MFWAAWFFCLGCICQYAAAPSFDVSGALLASKLAPPAYESTYYCASSEDWLDCGAGTSPTGCPSTSTPPPLLFGNGGQAAVDVSEVRRPSEINKQLLWAVWGRMELYILQLRAAMASGLGRGCVEAPGLPEKEAKCGMGCKEGKGKQGKDGKGPGPPTPSVAVAPTVPTLQALPKPPTATLPASPASTTGTPSASSGTEGTLQQILLALNRSRDDLPPAVRDILDSQIQEDSKAQAKSLHRLVAAQGAARRQLAATRAARQDFVREWASYVSGLCEMWKTQQEEKGQALAKFLETEAQWEQQLAETTAQIAKAATDPDGTEMIDLETDAMDEEDTKISELAQAEVQRQALVEKMRAADQKIADSLQAAAESAQKDALELGRPDRERSPRRRVAEPPSKEKAEKPDKAEGTDAGQKQPPMPVGGASKQRGRYECQIADLGVCSNLVLDKRSYPLQLELLSLPLALSLVPGQVHTQVSPRLPVAPCPAKGCPLSQRDCTEAPHGPLQVQGQVALDALSQRVRPVDCTASLLGMREVVPGDKKLSGEADVEHVGFFVPHQHPAAAPVSRAPTCKRPTDLQVLLAENMELLPDTVRGPFRYNPVGSVPALLGSEDCADDARFAVFDPVFHSRARRRGQDWSIIDCAADAVSATPTRIRAIQVILRPMTGLPVPQLTLCPVQTQRPNFVVPVDLRPVGDRICTVAVAPGDALPDVLAQAQAAACAQRLSLDRATHIMRDASGQQVDVLQEPLSQYEWLRVEPVAPVSTGGQTAEGEEATTTTCTFMEAFPPTLLGSFGLSTDVTRPRMLADATLWPRSIGTPIGANIPVAQLRLFPGFGIGAKHTVPFTLFVHGYPAIKLQGASSWSMLDFCRHAAVQIEEPPLLVQFLTSPVPGLDIPQITVTEAGIPQEGIVLPIDLRDVALEVTPMAVTAGTSLHTLLEQLGAIVPELGPALAPHLQHNRVFLQDCHGHVHDHLPAEPQALQWLAVRIGASPFPTSSLADPAPSLPFDVPSLTSTSTTTTTEMHAARPCVSFVLVCEGVTVRSEVMLASEVNVQQVLVELVRGLAGLSRLNQPFQLMLAPILPRTTAAQHYVVPLLASYSQAGETVFYDPGSDGLQLSSFTFAAGSAPEDALSAAQRRAGFRLRINGLPTSLCHRPLELGDYLQLVRADQVGVVAHHVVPLLEQIRELRLLTIPLDLPAVGLQLQGDQLVAMTVAQPRPFSDALRRILADRAARMGSPHIQRQSVWLLQAARAPHKFWLATPLTPSPKEAAALIEESGLFTNDLAILDTANTVATTAAAVFLAQPPDMSTMTFVVTDPHVPLCYNLMHLAGGVTVDVAALPAPPGMFYLPPPVAHVGSHFILRVDRGRSRGHEASASSLNFQPVQQAAIEAPNVEPAPAASEDPEPAGDAENTVSMQSQPGSSSLGHSSLSEGTSLACTSSRLAPRRQIIFDGPRTAISVPTPFGRQRISRQPQKQEADVISARRESEHLSAELPPDKPCVLCLNDMLRPAEQLPSPAASVHPESFQAPCQVEPALCLGLPAEARAQALKGFGLQYYCRRKPSGHGMHPAAAKFLNDIEVVGANEQLSAIMCYVDGSFSAGRASFAVVCLGLCQDQWKWYGYMADTVGESLKPGSAYEGELLAQVVALGTAACEDLPATVYYDCQSAALVAQGMASTSASTGLARAAVGLFMCSGTQAGWPAMAHVRSHQGHPVNELADWLAKRVLIVPEACVPLGDEHIADYINEFAFDWLWAYRAREAAHTWPAFAEDGVLVQEVPHASPGLPQQPSRWGMPSPDADAKRVDFCLRAVSYNALSCKSALQRQCLSSFMQQHEIAVLGIQEARHELCDTVKVDDVLRFGGPAPDGQLGCQLWVSLTAGPWVRTAFRKAFQNPRLLEVHARLGDQPLALFSCHTPTSVAPQAQRDAFWHMLRARLLALPAGHHPVISIDANARYSLVQGVEVPDSSNAECLESLLSDFGLLRTWAYEANGQPRITWRPPSGDLSGGVCLDYVLSPKTWPVSTEQQGVLKITDMHAGIDHEPIFAVLSGSLIRPPRPSAVLDRTAMLTDEGRRRLQEIYESMPAVPWDVSPDEHLCQLNTHLQHGLLQHFAGAPRPRKPAMSQQTWQLLADRRQLRRVHRRRAVLHSKWVLAQCFRAWRGDTSRVHTARVAAMRSLSSSLHEAHQRDEAEYVRLMYQDNRAQGPAALAKKIRSVLRCGRRAAAGVPSCLVVAGAPVTEHSAILQAFGEHFAAAEHAVPTTLSALQDATPAVTQRAELDLSGAPALADVCSAFASLKSGKAAGLSGIPPEAYSQCAAHAAVTHMPLVMKALGRGQLPVLWTGLKAHPIPKPAKPADRVEGYRSIALAEPAAKAVTKATRGVLVQAFEAVTLPTIGGARSGFPAEIPAMAVQAHLAMLKRTHRPGAAIFIDGVAAFYSVNRQHLFSGDAAALQDFIQSLQLDPEVQLRISNAIAGKGALERAALPPAIVRLLRIAFCRTWFTVDASSTQIYQTAKGTIPGSPLADLLFQYVAEASLKCLKEHLDDIGVSAVVAVDGAEVRASPQSWLDDITLLLMSADATRLPADIAAAMRLVSQYMAVLGIEVNFAAGKTETVIGWHGKRSATARNQTMVHDGGVISVDLPGGVCHRLRCVDDYVHLGNLRGYQASALVDLARREQLTRDVFRPFKRRILGNAHLSLAEKQTLLAGMILAKFTHGTGTWSLADARSRAAYQKAYTAFLRGSVRPLFGVPCRRLNSTQICALTGALTPAEAIAIRRNRLLSQLRDKADLYTRQCLVEEQSWLRAVKDDVFVLAKTLLHRGLQDYADAFSPCLAWIAGWPFGRDETSALLKRYRLTSIRNRAALVPDALAKAKAHEKAHQAGLIFLTLTPGCHPKPLHKCGDCGRSFSGPAQLAVHRSKKHGDRAVASEAWGTSCEVCRKQFWSTVRLREHFRRSPSWAHVYRHAEITEGAASLRQAPNSVPPVPWVGPAPWWATLRPTEAPSPAPCTQMPDASQLSTLAQVPRYIQQWVSMVEQGIAWHSTVRDEDWRRPPVQLAAFVAEHAHLDDGEHFFAVGGLAAVIRGHKVLLGAEEPLREARGSTWPLL
ncbi:unnamed protein product [Symbiodinium sp. KB8]|nr:unnamed protein product [Symbiodinium sp. KB8]